jgi:hypothetical protein
MGSTIQAGSSLSSVTTAKSRFTKGPGEVTEAVVATDFVQLGEPKSEAPLRFRDLDAATRADYKEAVKALASDGRLFVRQEDGSLKRAEPVEIKERLDRGQPVELVSQVASESRTSGHSRSASEYKQRGFFTAGWDSASSSHTHSGTQTVHYTSSPFSEWESLDFASEGKGVRGVAFLPASGNSVQISSQFESQWSESASRQWGIFTQKETTSQASGFVKEQRTAD